ncbi:MAG: 30S ribosomal protein S4e [Candidatus Aenigmarchaeota archaeon]|nr:30S ribosomal protein S4e [Candidatus Aenigmarchaeota archaeon]
MAYLKRLAMPPYWPVRKKERVLVVSPSPGPHGRQECIPIQVILRDMLGIAATAAEARKIVKQGKVLVDRKPRKDVGFPVGLMDVVEIPEAKKCFRVLPTRKGLGLVAVKEEEAGQKICKITGKSFVKGGKVQLHLHDGRNVLANKSDAYKVGDSVMVQLPAQKISKHYKLEKGAQAIILGGKNRGEKGVVKDIRKRKNMLETPTATIKSGTQEIDTLISYLMVGEF